VYGDWRSSDGRLLAPGMTLSSEPLWYLYLGFDQPSAFGIDYERYFVYNNASIR
jgi:hypothetical protein